MAQIKLSATLPKDDTGNNGLDTLHRALIQLPNVPQYVIGIVTASKTVTDHKRGNAKLPEVEFTAIEGVDEATDRDAVQAMLQRARRVRLGEQPNLFDDDVDV